MIYNTGGWYSDFDVSCLKPYTFTESDTVIRYDEQHASISNICKFNKGDNILLDLYESTKKAVTKHNTTWVTPLEIFNKKIYEYGYDKYIVKDYLGNDNFTKFIKPLLTSSIIDINITGKYAIHWCRSALSTGNWSSGHYYDTANPFPGTILSLLYSKYSI